MRTHTIIRPLTVALLAAGALAVAACGGDDGGGSGGTSAADRESKAREALLEHARCMREHGVNMPDPTFEGGGGVKQTGPAEGTSRAKVKEAEKACQKYLDEIEPPNLSDEEQQEFKEAALANARCMREHGIENFPDPTFGEDGRAELRIDKASGIDPNDADFKEAEKACQETMPGKPSQDSAP